MTRTDPLGPRRPAPRPSDRPARPLPVAALALAVVAAGGCAARGATLGAEIDAAGERYASIAEEWEDGQDKVDKGRKLVRRGRERVRDGEDDMERGRELIAEGEREMAQSERNYERLKASSPAGAGPAPGD